MQQNSMQQGQQVQGLKPGLKPSLDQDSIDPDVVEVLVLSDADRAALNAQAGRGLLLALAAQGAMGLAAAVIAGVVVGGAAAGWSALAGAGAYFIPNALFALRLAVSVRAGKASPFTFLSGELIKLFATALLLWLLSRVTQDWLVWPAALLGLILTLKGYLLLLMFRRLS
nr:ATP synthase subunit I [Achromobacter sp. UBA2119]